MDLLKVSKQTHYKKYFEDKQTLKLFEVAFIKLYMQRKRKITFFHSRANEWANFHRQTQDSWKFQLIFYIDWKKTTKSGWKNIAVGLDFKSWGGRGSYYQGVGEFSEGLGGVKFSEGARFSRATMFFCKHVIFVATLLLISSALYQIETWVIKNWLFMLGAKGAFIKYVCGGGKGKGSLKS